MEKLSKDKIKEIKDFAAEIRKNAFFTMANLGTGHVGGVSSICEILSYLYSTELKNIDPKNPNKEDRDLYIQSKGHAGPALYATLALKGYFDQKLLLTLNRIGTSLPSHCDKTKTPGIDMSTGSLGQGFSVATGAAKGIKIKGENRNVYTLIGDGETDEGQIWEAAMFASHHKLDNLIAITDKNNLQLDDFTDNIISLGDLKAKWESFGWEVVEANGHDIESLHSAFSSCHDKNGKPKMIIAHTVKGKDFARLENKVSSHSSTLTVDELKEMYNGEVPSWM